MFISGFGHRYVQAHEPVGRPEDDGGDQESGRIRSSPTRQLHRQNPGKIQIYLKEMFSNFFCHRINLLRQCFPLTTERNQK